MWFILIRINIFAYVVLFILEVTVSPSGVKKFYGELTWQVARTRSTL